MLAPWKQETQVSREVETPLILDPHRSSTPCVVALQQLCHPH